MYDRRLHRVCFESWHIRCSPAPRDADVGSGAARHTTWEKYGFSWAKRCVRELASEWEGSVAKEDRGFASMDRAKQREIASKGGKAAHQKGTAHEWTSEEAREAGRKGGMASHRRRKEMMDQGGNTESSSMSSTPDSDERSGGDDTNEQIR